MPPSPGAREAYAPCRWRTACRCCLPHATGARWRRRTPAGAGSPRGWWRRRWRGAAAPAGLIAWLGPAIGPAHFEVGGEVRAAFLAHDAAAAAAFTANTRGRWQCDLSALARRRLSAAGVTAVFGSWCTSSDPLRFFSYRRAGQCGRMAALIWLA